MNMAMHSSSQICLMEMMETVVMSLKTWADCAFGEKLFEIFKVASKSGLTTLLLAT